MNKGYLSGLNNQRPTIENRASIICSPSHDKVRNEQDNKSNNSIQFYNDEDIGGGTPLSNHEGSDISQEEAKFNQSPEAIQS